MTVVETRRFRTWEPDTAFDPRRAWRILVRYHAIRIARSWWLATLLVVVGLVHVVNVGTFSYAAAEGDGVRYGEIGPSLFGLLAAGVAMVLVVGSGLLAEDLRLRAPLFYFSRPVDRSQYVRAKATFLAGLLAAVSLLPLAVMWVLYLAYGWYLAAPSDTLGASAQRQWELTHLDTFGEAFLGGLLALFGLALVLAFLGSAMLLASACTQRGWHAALAFVAVLGGAGTLGVIASDLADDSVYGHVYGPFGWIQLALDEPFQGLFGVPALEAYTVENRDAQWERERLDYHQGWPGAVALGYLALAGCTVLFLWLTQRRVRRQEEDL